MMMEFFLPIMVCETKSGQLSAQLAVGERLARVSYEHQLYRGAFTPSVV